MTQTLPDANPFFGGIWALACTIDQTPFEARFYLSGVVPTSLSDVTCTIPPAE